MKRGIIILGVVACLSAALGGEIVRITSNYQSDDRYIQDEISVWVRGPTISGQITSQVDPDDDGIFETVPVDDIVLVVKDQAGEAICFAVSGPDGKYRFELEMGSSGVVEPLGKYQIEGEPDIIVFPVSTNKDILRGRVVRDLVPSGAETEPMGLTLVRFDNPDNSLFGYAVTGDDGTYEIMTPGGFQGSGNVIGEVTGWQP